MNLRRPLLIASLLLALPLAPSFAPAQSLDQYGGYAGLSVPGGATGYFRVAKMGNRWVFATPEGNAFWMRGVYVVNPSGTEVTFPDKYPDKNTWGVQAVRRMRAWGFNTVGEYADPSALPVRAYGGTYANPEKLPFIRLIRPSQFALNNRFGWAGQPNPEVGHGVKSVVLGLDPNVYKGGSGWRGSPLLDVFDPNFEATVAGVARDTKTVATATTQSWAPIFWTPAAPTGLRDSPWVLGTSIDDADWTWGFKRTTDPHIGWMVLVTAPTQRGPATPYSGISVPAYRDPKVYSKYALRDFLATRYGSIAALNAAWGSTYTTFDSNGGWPIGRGLLDESGRNPWTLTNAQYSELQNPAVQKDLDDFMYLFARRYFGLAVTYLKEVQPNHPVFTQAPLHDAKPLILKAARDAGIDAVQLHVSSYATETGDQPGLAELETRYLRTSYEAFGGPVFFWTTFTAQAESPMAGYPNNWGPFDAQTQANRAAGYADFLRRLLTWRSDDGTNHVVGIDWWSWSDHPGEHENFGLVTLKDNAYDGKQAVVVAGKDPWGYPTGGEQHDYGNFLGPVTQAHNSVYAQLSGAALASPPSIPATSGAVSIISPTSGSVVQGLVSVAAAGAGTLSRIDFALDEKVVKSFYTTNVKFAWDTRTVPNGAHRWTATAYNALGSTAASSSIDLVVKNTVTAADRTPPSVSITVPSFSPKSRITIRADATDNLGVKKVEFYVEGRLTCTVTTGPYTCEWKVPAAKKRMYGFQAKAYDAQGNVGASPTVGAVAQLISFHPKKTGTKKFLRHRETQDLPFHARTTEKPRTER